MNIDLVRKEFVNRLELMKSINSVSLTQIKTELDQLFIEYRTRFDIVYYNSDKAFYLKNLKTVIKVNLDELINRDMVIE